MKDIILNNLNALLGGLVTATVGFIVYMYKNPDKLSVFINATLIPFKRGSIKIIKPTAHPIFAELISYRDYDSQLVKFPHQAIKQQIWELYMHHFFKIMHEKLHSLASEDHAKLTQQEFDLLTEKTFALAFAIFLKEMKRRVELPREVLMKLQKFERRQVESFRFVVNVWKNDKRFFGIRDANSIQIYNILNDMQSRFRDFWADSHEFFKDFNGLLEKEAIIKSLND